MSFSIVPIVYILHYCLEHYASVADVMPRLIRTLRLILNVLLNTTNSIKQNERFYG